MSWIYGYMSQNSDKATKVIELAVWLLQSPAAHGWYDALRGCSSKREMLAQNRNCESIIVRSQWYNITGWLPTDSKRSHNTHSVQSYNQYRFHRFSERGKQNFNKLKWYRRFLFFFPGWTHSRVYITPVRLTTFQGPQAPHQTSPNFPRLPLGVSTYTKSPIL